MDADKYCSYYSLTSRTMGNNHWLKEPLDRNEEQTDAFGRTEDKRSPGFRFLFSLKCILSPQLLHERDCHLLLSRIGFLRRYRRCNTQITRECVNIGAILSRSWMCLPVLLFRGHVGRRCVLERVLGCKKGIGCSFVCEAVDNCNGPCPNCCCR